MCPRSSECHYTLAVPEVRRILEHSARIGGTSNLAFTTVRLMKTWVDFQHYLTVTFVAMPWSCDEEPNPFSIHIRSLILSIHACALCMSARRYFDEIVPPHIARHSSPFSRECFSPLCGESMELPDAAVLATLQGSRPHGTASCKRCRHDWCLACQHVAHPGISCHAAERMAGKWQEFMTTHPSLFADSELVKQLRAKYQEDEQTADSVRRCPHCKKGPIFRIDGCDTMVCDAIAHHASIYTTHSRRACLTAFLHCLLYLR